MIIYVNGDSHSAGAEAANAFCFLSDDPAMTWQDHHDLTQTAAGRAPHPNNIKVSYGQKIADHYNATLVCAAESGSSNQRILRTTYDYLKTNPNPDLVIIGWATWEREEVIIDNKMYQFAAGLGTRDQPTIVQEHYRNWVVDRWHPNIYCKAAQQEIWTLHQKLLTKQIPHLFFNTYHYLEIPKSEQYNWGNSYIDPYHLNSTYYMWLKNQGFATVDVESHHYRANAHQAWANHLTNILKESIITI